MGDSLARKSRADLRSISCSSLKPKSIGVPSLGVGEHGDAPDSARATQVVGEADLGILHLPRAGLVPELLAHLVDHAHAGGADRVAERLEAAARVDRHLTAVDRGAALGDVAPALTRCAQPEVLVVQALRGG